MDKEFENNNPSENNMENTSEPEQADEQSDSAIDNKTDGDTDWNDPVNKPQEENEQDIIGNLESPNNNLKESKPKKRKGKWGNFLSMIAAAIIGSVLTLVIVSQTNLLNSTDHAPNASVPQQQSDTNGSETAATPVNASGSAADIVENASDAIVGITNMGQEQNPFFETTDEVQKGVGSGVIYKVDKNAAYIVTNNHVIADASSIQVSLANGDNVDGELVGTDPLTDIAVVKITGKFDMKPITFGDSDALRSGDQVIAIGNPLGLDLSRTVTQGIVSATDRTIPVQTSAGEWEFNVIQTDAAINPGNSGGALLNSKGELVGINSLKIAENGVEGLGFAIPSNDVNELINEISEHGKIVRPYVGVGIKSVSEIPPYYLKELPENVKDGVVVLSVDEQSAAAKAGIEVEDVIVAINGENITNDKEFRTYLYKNLSAGDKVKIDLYHQGKKKQVEVTLTSNADVK